MSQPLPGLLQAAGTACMPAQASCPCGTWLHAQTCLPVQGAHSPWWTCCGHSPAGVVHEQPTPQHALILPPGFERCCRLVVPHHRAVQVTHHHHWWWAVGREGRDGAMPHRVGARCCDGVVAACGSQRCTGVLGTTPLHVHACSCSKVLLCNCLCRRVPQQLPNKHLTRATALM